MKLTKAITFIGLSLVSLQCLAVGGVYCGHGVTPEDAIQSLNAQITQNNSKILGSPTVSSYVANDPYAKKEVLVCASTIPLV